MSESAQSSSSQARAPESARKKAPAGKTDRQPVCFIVGQDSRTVQMVSSLGELGLRLQGFDDIGNMLEAARRRQPDVIFIDFDPDASGATVIDALIASKLSCPIQLMSKLSPALVEEVRRKGRREGLNMLPVLYEPFGDDAVRQVVNDLSLTRDFSSTQRLKLEDALAKNWLEAWYQPKIDLYRRCLVGAEVFVRVRHPEHGMVELGHVLANASETDLLTLTSYMLATALRDWRDFADLCPEIKIAVNIPVASLVKLPIAAIVKNNRPKQSSWPGIIVEIKEDDAIAAASLVQDVAKEFASLKIGLAVDDCGLGYDSLARLHRPPFCELKIDRSFVAACATDILAADVCQTYVDLARELGATPVAEGIETTRQLKVLVGMRCEVGQGYLFARPMAKDQLLAQIRRRAETGRRPRAASSRADAV